MHLKLRRRAWFRRFTIAIVSASIIGLLLSIIGVQLHGLEPIVAVLNWLAALVAIGGLGFLPLAVLATLENEEDLAASADLAERLMPIKQPLRGHPVLLARVVDVSAQRSSPVSGSSEAQFTGGSNKNAFASEKT